MQLQKPIHKTKIAAIVLRITIFITASIGNTISAFCTSLCPQYLAVLPISKESQNRIAEAKEIVKMLDGRFAQNIESTGFSSWENLIEAIQGRDSISSSLLQALSENKFDIAIHAKSRWREFIFENGLQNARTVPEESSNGSPQEYDKIEGRLAYHETPYAEIDPFVKPKYGLLRATEVVPDISNLITSYGDDVWILKASAVGNRVTWVPGDSIQFYPRPGDPVWQTQFIPWSRRALMIPFLRDAIERGRLLPAVPPEGYEVQGIAGQERLRPPEKVGSGRSSKLGNTFVELQVWGPITMHDIRAFEFQKEPPSPELEQKLSRLGIEILDGRIPHRPAVRWRRIMPLKTLNRLPISDDSSAH